MAESWLRLCGAGPGEEAGPEGGMEEPDALDDSLTSLQWLQEFSILNAKAPTLPPGGTDPHGYHQVPGLVAPGSPLAADPACLGQPHTPGKPTSSCTSRSAPPGLQAPPPDDVDYATNPHVKPPYSYATLICMAMQASKATKITLSAIYKWITDNFCYFRHADPTWQNSIRLQAWFILGTTGSVLGELPQFRFSFLQEPALISAMLAAAGSLVAAIWAALHLRILLLSAVTFLFLADFLKNRRPKNYPPGPMRLPFVGCLFHLDPKQPHLSLQQFVKKYGNVLSLDFANIPSVVITGMPLIKEIFTQMEHNFMNRPVTLLRKHLFNKNGLIFSSDQTWKEQRRFALMTLRNFGLGKRSLEERIQEEAHYLVEAIRDEGGQPFDPHFNISNAVSNIICSITFGERFDYHDSQFQEMLRLLDEAMCLESSMMCQLYNIFPRILQYLPGSHQTLFRNWRKLQLFVSDIVNNHRRDWDPDEPRDFIDAFLTEMTKYPDKTTTSFNEENLICSTLDLFFAGTETTSTTLRWALLCMALYPEVQEKMQAEIDRVIGQARQPNLADRDSMPYTNAVIHEVQRMGNIIPFNVPREVAVDTQLAGFNLPKGIMVLSNLTALHRDPSEWTTPDTFNPEHFLENGQFKKRESFLPFSMGKRACLGEQLARSELFIFITTLFQKFTFKPPVNEKLSLQFRMAATVSPVSHRLCAIPRL